MAIISFLINLAGATMLLLFAVRMVRTGIERNYGAAFQRAMTRKSGLIKSGFTGIILAVILQSSAAVALLTAGFAVTGFVGFSTGFAMVLGADLGSALVIQILSFRLEWLVPLLLAVGGWLFVKTEQKRWRQLGRIVMGIALILISLRFLREAVEPIQDSAFLPAIAGYLERDYVTAFLTGAALAFVMHSSVATILMCVTLVQVGAIPFAAGASLVLGANLGSALIPIWLTRGMPQAARPVPVANLITRGAWAVIALFAVNLLPLGEFLGNMRTGQDLVYVHLAFNTMLFVIMLPFCRWIEAPVMGLVNGMASPDKDAADPSQTSDTARDVTGHMPSLLDPKNPGSPAQALAGLKREVLRMSDRVEAMFAPVISLYESCDKVQIIQVREMDEQVNNSLSLIRAFVASAANLEFSKPQTRIVRDLMEYAIRLESAGDIVAKRFCTLAEDLCVSKAQFSEKGWKEISRMHEGILANMKLASNILISDDLESARLLSLEKTEVKRAEGNSRKRHLKRLQKGDSASFETSDVHLETIRAFREFNGHIAAVAYPILYANGQLLETRLIQEIDTVTELPPKI